MFVKCVHTAYYIGTMLLDLMQENDIEYYIAHDSTARETSTQVVTALNHSREVMIGPDRITMKIIGTSDSFDHVAVTAVSMVTQVNDRLMSVNDVEFLSTETGLAAAIYRHWTLRSQYAQNTERRQTSNT